jgi:hypothetical protein
MRFDRRVVAEPVGLGKSRPPGRFHFPQGVAARLHESQPHLQMRNAAIHEILLQLRQAGPYTHTGIYVGNGKFIHRPTADKPAVVSKLTGYNLEHYTGARRMAVA